LATTTVDVRQAVADWLHKDVTALEAFWSGTVSWALAKAIQDVYGVLRARFFTDVQIAAWTYLDPVILSQAMFWALKRGAGADVDTRQVDVFDMREYLQTVGLLEATGSSVGHGPLAAVEGETSDTFIGRDNFVDPLTGKFRDQ
jgi:hypothetical protein